jgi:hypothetical protein
MSFEDIVEARAKQAEKKSRIEKGRRRKREKAGSKIIVQDYVTSEGRWLAPVAKMW